MLKIFSVKNLHCRGS